MFRGLTATSRWQSAWTVTAIYAVLAVVMTWPLVTRMSRDVAWDMGDPLLNCWILMWTGGQVLHALAGHPAALAQYFNGNIFYPERLTIAYSEHLTPQMLQILPVLAITKNVILGYNLLFLSTIVLSGLAMYLLVRELTGRPVAAFIAGLAFAFAPYRVAQYPHIQMLSCYWIPLALLGFRRFFVTGRTRPLAGGAAALAVQNLSCGYLMLFFGPFAVAYCLYEMAHRKLLMSWRTWAALGIAAIGIAVVTYPFLVPYAKVRATADVGVRPIDEIVMFSADSHAYGTSAQALRLLGAKLQARTAPEGEGFQGFTIMALALVGVVAGVRRAVVAARGSPMRAWQQIAAGILLVAVAVAVAALVSVFVAGGFTLATAGGPIFVRNGEVLLEQIGILLVALLVLVPVCRRFIRGTPDSAFGFFAWSCVFAALLSLGPYMHVGGRSIGTGLYWLLYTYAPGFDGLRVPARYFMLVALFLSVLTGYGAAALLARWRRAALVLLAVAGVAILAESWVVPFQMSVRVEAEGLQSPPGRVFFGDQLNPLYKIVTNLGPDSVLCEFPYGDPAYDIQYTFYAAFHRHKILNGYSGFFPTSFLRRIPFLGQVWLDPDAAWRSLMSSGATHAIVHERAFRDEHGREISDWLRGHNAREMATFGTDHLFQVR